VKSTRNLRARRPRSSAASVRSRGRCSSGSWSSISRNAGTAAATRAFVSPSCSSAVCTSSGQRARLTPSHGVASPGGGGGAAAGGGEGAAAVCAYRNGPSQHSATSSAAETRTESSAGASATDIRAAAPLGRRATLSGVPAFACVKRGATQARGALTWRAFHARRVRIVSIPSLMRRCASRHVLARLLLRKRLRGVRRGFSALVRLGLGLRIRQLGAQIAQTALIQRSLLAQRSSAPVDAGRKRVSLQAKQAKQAQT